MNADFQLRHATVSRHGSFWFSQTDKKTIDMLRELSRTSAIPSRLQHIDVGGAFTLNANRSIQEGLIIDFRDGHFVTTGTDMQAYVPAVLDDTQSPVIHGLNYVRNNNSAGVTGTTPRAHSLSMFNADEVASLTADVPQLSRPGVWFLIPKPVEINPITLATVKSSVELVYGIDFFTSKNFIITQLPPAEYFPAGSIVVSVAEVSFESFDSYPSDSPRIKQSRKWTNIYAKRAQSLELFRRAAAEFCGLYVLPDNDVVLNAIQRADDSVVYAFANAGVVAVNYAHTPLITGTAYPAGYVVCDQFEIRNVDSHGQSFLTSSESLIDLSGVFGLPVQMEANGMVPCSYYYADNLMRPHLRLHLNGSQEHLSIIWAMQMTHERAQGTNLAAEIGGDIASVDTFPAADDETPVVNYAELLTGFYGRRLALLVIDGLPNSSKFELSRFLREHTPTGMVVLLADLDAEPVIPPPPIVSDITYAEDELHYQTSVITYE